MRIEHLELEMLSAYADGELAGAAQMRAERHLGDCAACRDMLHRVRALVQGAAALPRDVVPPEAVWEGIRRGMRARVHRRSWARMAGFAVAAGLIAVVATMWLRPGRSEKVMAAGPEPQASATFASIERNYRTSIDELRFTLEQQRGTLSPATVRVLERSMAVIDAAIAEARAALVADPANRAIADILAAQYEHKVNLLQRATKLSPSI